MARNRQRAKQRQAERRARRLAQQGGAGAAQPKTDGPAEGVGGSIPGVDAPRTRPVPPVDDPTTVDPSPAVPPDLAVGAPPTDEGRSDRVVEDEPALAEEPLTEDEALREIEDWEVAPEDEVAERGAGEAGYEARGRRGRAAEAHKDRPRVIQFLIAVWAELQRVQWPNRQALVTLTGVVLGFVLIAGGYLGLLDAIFSELIQALL
jgi:preprotein translocase subunit SecE